MKINTNIKKYSDPIKMYVLLKRTIKSRLQKFTNHNLLKERENASIAMFFP